MKDKNARIINREDIFQLRKELQSLTRVWSHLIYEDMVNDKTIPEMVRKKITLIRVYNTFYGIVKDPYMMLHTYKAGVKVRDMIHKQMKEVLSAH